MQRQFYLYVNALSDIGTRMHLIGITALIFTFSDSALGLSLYFISRQIGGVLSSLYAGVLADRFDRRWLMIWSDVIRAAALLMIIIWPNAVTVMIGSFLLGFMYAPFQVSFTASIPQIFGEERAYEVNAQVTRLTSIAGIFGFIAGGYIATMIGWQWVFWLDIASYLLSAAFLLPIRWDSKPSGTAAVRPRLWTDVREVAAYIRRLPWLWMPSAMIFMVTLGSCGHNFAIPVISTMIDPVNQNTIHGYFWAALGAGSLIGAMLLPRLPWIRQHLQTSYVIAALLSSVLLIFALSFDTFWPVLGLLFVAGIADAGIGTLHSTIMQQTDNHIRGRVLGVQSLLNRLGFLIGFTIAPFLYEGGLSLVVWVLNGSIVISALVSLAWLRRNPVTS